MSFAEEIVLPGPEDPLEEERLAQAHRLNDGAMTLRNAGKSSAVALSTVKRALALIPGAPFILSNMGLILWDMGDLAGARRAFEQAIEGDPTNHRYHGNLGVFASAIADPDLAEKHLTEAIRLTGGAPGPKWDYSLLHLWQGKWEQGLAEYDVRRAHRGPSLYPGMPYPMWQGEDLNGKSIYIQGEQGTGDKILFSRYIAWLKETYPKCTIYAHLRDDLANLFWEFETAGIIERFLPNSIPWPKGIDYSCYLMSLPHYHGSRREEWIPPDPGLIRKRVVDQNSLKNMPMPGLPSVNVGICWTGNPSQTRNLDRSVPLDLMVELAEDPRIQLYSVQVGPGNDDLDRTGARKLVIDLAGDIVNEGWVGTGQVLMKLDVVITVCTAVAHLAGALGCNVWTLLCKEPYWVWPREGDRTAWYPSMKLFRQKDFRGWRPVITEVKSELGRLADTQIGPA